MTTLTRLEKVLALTHNPNPREAAAAAGRALGLIADLQPTFFFEAGTTIRYVAVDEFPHTTPASFLALRACHFYHHQLEQPQALAHGWLCWHTRSGLYLFFVRTDDVKVRV